MGSVRMARSGFSHSIVPEPTISAYHPPKLRLRSPRMKTTDLDLGLEPAVGWEVDLVTVDAAA
jgi:hypothetical protein